LQALELYQELTAGRTRFLRVEELCRLGAERHPDRLPGAQALAAEAKRPLKDKQRLEAAQGEFLAAILADPACGTHLCHAMLLPREASRQKLAEDETTLAGMETAVDLALLDPKTEVCVLRGAPVEHAKYAGKRIFGAGINLTHLYQGKIRYLWYLIRDLGVVNKFYRGLAVPEKSPEEHSIEKIWIAAVEGFAIGGHCQILLTMDYTLAAQDAYLTLPARKEGIVPGAANLRLPRFVGDRIARQAVMAERRIDCASPEGQMICDEIVVPEKIDEAIEKAVQRLTGSGVVSAASNRRAFRAGEEPLDAFRRYMAVYAREQAYCHFSPALVANLEKNWKVK